MTTKTILDMASEAVIWIIVFHILHTVKLLIYFTGLLCYLMLHFWLTINWLVRYFHLGQFNFSFLNVPFPTNLDWVSTCHFKDVFQKFDRQQALYTLLKPLLYLQLLQGYISLSSTSFMKILKVIFCPGQTNARLCWHVFLIWRDTNSNQFLLTHHRITMKQSPSLPTGMWCGTGWNGILNSRFVPSTDFYGSVTLSKVL